MAELSGPSLTHVARLLSTQGFTPSPHWRKAWGSALQQALAVGDMVIDDFEHAVRR